MALDGDHRYTASFHERVRVRVHCARQRLTVRAMKPTVNARIHFARESLDFDARPLDF